MKSYNISVCEEYCVTDYRSRKYCLILNQSSRLLQFIMNPAGGGIVLWRRDEQQTKTQSLIDYQYLKTFICHCREFPRHSTVTFLFSDRFKVISILRVWLCRYFTNTIILWGYSFWCRLVGIKLKLSFITFRC